MPLYEHDCDKCIYLGPFRAAVDDGHEPNVEHDLYICGTKGNETLIARYSSDPPDYTSGMIFGRMRRNDPGSPIGEAYRRAIGRGHYTPPEVTWNTHDTNEYREEVGALIDDPDFRIACEEMAMNKGRTVVDFTILGKMTYEERRKRRIEGK